MSSNIIISNSQKHFNKLNTKKSIWYSFYGLSLSKNLQAQARKFDVATSLGMIILIHCYVQKFSNVYIGSRSNKKLTFTV